MRWLRLTTTRSVQIGFLVLLAVCMAQMVYWIVDEILTSRSVRDDALAVLDDDVRQAERMLQAGIAPDEVQALFEHLQVESESGSVTVRPARMAGIEDTYESRINRFVWEGAFFLTFLLLGAVILLVAIRQQARLRKREQDFQSAVSHELKSPLASIRLAAETLELRTPDDAGTARPIRRLMEDVERLQTLIQNLLQTNRIDEVGVHVQSEPVAVRDALHDVVEAVQSRLERSQVQLHVTADDPDLWVRAHSPTLQTVLVNLVDNAAKATTNVEGGEIRLAAHSQNGHVEMTVTDNGVGFAPSESDRIFEKFYRLGDEIRRTSPGSGLGLYLVRRLVESQGGKVTAHSKGPGTGAVFRVVWPGSPPGSAAP